MNDVIHVDRRCRELIHLGHVLDRDRALLTSPIVEVVLDPGLVKPNERQRVHDLPILLKLSHILSICMTKSCLINLHDDINP